MAPMRARAAAVILAALAVPGPAAPAEPASVGGAPRAPAPAALEGGGDPAATRRALRAALFACQEAVYLEPRNAAARTRLGRAYLALGYVARARAQAEHALTLAPGDADARRLLDDALAGDAPHRTGARAPAGAGARAASLTSSSSASSGSAGRPLRPPRGRRA